MAGRYGFAMPSPQHRDGWFRVGQVDVTTTVLITGLGVLSMLVYAVDPGVLYQGVFVSPLVREGDLWRAVTWPLVNPPTDLFMVLGLVFYWYFGRFVEEEMGRIPYTWTTVAMTVLPALAVTGLNVLNDDGFIGADRWTVATFSVDLLGIAVLCIFILERPSARFMFNIPGWAIGLVIVGMRVLNGLGMRAWGTLTMLMLVILVGLVGARQAGMLRDIHAIPRFGGSTTGPSKRRRAGSGRSQKRSKPQGPKRGSKRGGSVVEGPWASASKPSTETSAGGALTPLEQAELDSLLDIIGEKGINSLSVAERTRLNELSDRLRGR